ncbi:MAG: acyl carrier protein [Propionibacteriaceae bacterium]|nr:acyl carrier protein [Propionibacteriaceae bacterium]
MTAINPSSTIDKDVLMSDLIGYIGEVIGPETVEVLNVGPRTKFFTDLGVNSIDLVRMIELVNDKYPVAEELVHWIADKNILYLSRATLGDIADLIYNVLG